MIRTVPLIVACLALTGCSILSTPTQRANVSATFMSPIFEDGTDNPTGFVDSARLTMPEAWNEGSVDVDIVEEYATDGGREALKSRRVYVRRNTNPEVAGGVAAARAGITSEVISGAIEGAVRAAVEAALPISLAKEAGRTERRQIDATRDVKMKELEPIHHEEPAPEPAPAAVAP